MYQYKTVIITKDGKQFDTEQQADNYISDKVCEEINEILKGKHFRNLTAFDLIEIIKHLSGDVERIKRLKAIIDTYIGDGE